MNTTTATDIRKTMRAKMEAQTTDSLLDALDLMEDDWNSGRMDRSEAMVRRMIIAVIHERHGISDRVHDLYLDTEDYTLLQAIRKALSEVAA